MAIVPIDNSASTEKLYAYTVFAFVVLFTPIFSTRIQLTNLFTIVPLGEGTGSS